MRVTDKNFYYFGTFFALLPRNNPDNQNHHDNPDHHFAHAYVKL